MSAADADRAAVLAAARARADALAAGDAAALTGLLHEDFRWTAHTGATFDREEYVRRNTDGTTVWRSQDLADADIAVVGDTAVVRAEVTDVVEGGDGGSATFRMPMTQTWVREGGRWRCLAGHAGPRRTD
ncbi:nuclear transport factor 2 family protein [Nocardioides iriomotensis]|uniref:Nuclear transport factor 2 family protein n=1 Tax=Nocardioides iriomotensis TaxID=715784 RepID=A0A4Q5IYF3_9ACTN|nr:nuclear transport factor 2 family protein [Nocardioides iriomotensis]RYU09965.1 nuclear transport factor 2 family protein [Nocardioides iriomotensis]